MIHLLNDGEKDLKIYNPKKNHILLGHRSRELFFLGIRLYFIFFYTEQHTMIPSNF